jgi:hypothetical protein
LIQIKVRIVGRSISKSDLEMERTMSTGAAVVVGAVVFVFVLFAVVIAYAELRAGGHF